jgi:hypothetical protein
MGDRLRSLGALCRGSNRGVDTAASAAGMHEQEHDELVLGSLGPGRDNTGSRAAVGDPLRRRRLLHKNGPTDQRGGRPGRLLMTSAAPML